MGKKGKKGKKSGSSKKKKGGKKGRKSTEPQMTWKEALLAYQWVYMFISGYHSYYICTPSLPVSLHVYLWLPWLLYLYS